MDAAVGGSVGGVGSGVGLFGVVGAEDVIFLALVCVLAVVVSLAVAIWGRGVPATHV